MVNLFTGSEDEFLFGVSQSPAWLLGVNLRESSLVTNSKADLGMLLRKANQDALLHVLGTLNYTLDVCRVTAGAHDEQL